MAQTTRSADLTSGPMLQKIILFSIPLAASSILQLLFNAADVVVVGRFAGSTALAAVGSNGSLINLLVNLFVGLSLGANVVAARCFGAKDERGVQDTVQTSVTLGLVSGVLLAVVGFFAARGLLELMSCPEDVIDLSSLYLKIYFIGMPMTMLYNFSSALLRAVGDTKRPLYCLAAAGVINVVLNLVFVIGFSMSVAGVALATIISETVSACMVTRMLMKEQGPLHLDLRKLGFHAGSLKQILLIGLPAGLQSTVFSLSNVVIQSAINSFGSTVVAGSSASANLEGFVYTAMNAFAQAAVTFTSETAQFEVVFFTGETHLYQPEHGRAQVPEPEPRGHQLPAVRHRYRCCAGRRCRAGRQPAAALLLLGRCRHRCRIRPPAHHLRHLSAVRHHGCTGQQPARSGLQRAAHGGEPCGQLPAASGVDRDHLPAESHALHAVHQLPHQLDPDRCRTSGLPAGGAPQDEEQIKAGHRKLKIPRCLTLSVSHTLDSSPRKGELFAVCGFLE